MAILFLSAFSAFGQEGPLVSKNFQFADGIYLSHTAFQHNQPDFPLSEIKANLFTNPQTFLTQVDSISVWQGKKLEPLDPMTIWIVCLGGIPYVRLPKGAVNKELATFAGLQLRGKICYFRYENLESRSIPMVAYNPATGKPFREAVVQRNVLVTYEKMLHFETGEIADFTVEHFLAWIQDDPELTISVRELGRDEVLEKLFKCLLIYDDRNVVRIYSNH